MAAPLQVECEWSVKTYHEFSRVTKCIRCLGAQRRSPSQELLRPFHGTRTGALSATDGTDLLYPNSSS